VQDYLAHPVLAPRLIECAEIVAAHRELSAEQIFGGWLGLRGRKLDPALFMYVSGDPPIRPGRRPGVAGASDEQAAGG